jgi:Rrf2 family nitric oxide-sensitive transcriptional repressor
MFMVECFDAATNTCRVTQTCHLKHYLFDASNEFINTLNQHTLGDTVT